MKLLANENFPLKSILYLRSKGFDVISIGSEVPGIQDQQVINLANVQGRTILTFDRDYGEIIFKYSLRPSKGVIYLRLDEYIPEEPGKIVENLIRDKKIDFENTLTVFDKNDIRQRKY